MFKAIIIDDEKDAIESLELKINQYCHNVEIVGRAQSVVQGINEIESKNPDIVFLDIRMPDGGGFNLLESIKSKNFELIFVTAYDQFAIKAFKYSAVDYLLKPVDINELINAIKNIEERKCSTSEITDKYETLLENLKSDTPKKTAITSIEGIEYIDIDDIIRIEADKCYSNVYTNEKPKITVSKNLSEIEKLLSDNKDFFRIHKSHIVNLTNVSKFTRKIYGGSIKMSDNSIVDVSHRKKTEFLKALKNLNENR